MRNILVIITALLLTACAQINPITGGERDKTAPQIDSAKTFPLNGTVNFTGNEIKLTFDEYITLKNPSSNILITPQLKVQPDIKTKNKTFKLKFNEILSPNTTYSISFNRAIADYAEGNDSVFQYVFSTGSFIDSLRISGKVTDSYTNKPIKDLVVGLYPESDTMDYKSIAKLSKPLYLTVTDIEGNYKINYIKNGKYHILVFSDLDRNLLYNPETEQIGFSDQHVISIDSNLINQNFRVFTNENTEVKLKASNLYYPGKLELIFSNPPIDFTANYTTPMLEEKTGREDSLVFWLTKPYSNKDPFVFNYNGQSDTTRLIMKNIPKTGEVLPLSQKNNLDVNKVLPYDTLTFFFSEPLDRIDQNLIHLYDKDSVELPFSAEINYMRLLKIYTSDQTDRFVTLDSGAVHSSFDDKTNSEIKLSYDYHSTNYFGKLILEIDTDSVDRIIELLDKKGNLVKSVELNRAATQLEFSDLKPQQYQLRYISDNNKDGKWTAGDLETGRQPERVLYYETQIKVRSNWEMEIEWHFTKPLESDK